MLGILPAGLSCAPKPPPPPPVMVRQLEYHATFGSGQDQARLSIAPYGMYNAADARRGFAEGRLSDAQKAAIQRIFAGWDHMPTTYPTAAGGPSHVLMYGHHAVAGGALTRAPTQFQAAVQLLQKLADQFKWKKKR